jgi:hypothetical protein
MLRTVGGKLFLVCKEWLKPRPRTYEAPPAPNNGGASLMSTLLTVTRRQGNSRC